MRFNTSYVNNEAGLIGANPALLITVQLNPFVLSENSN